MNLNLPKTDFPIKPKSEKEQEWLDRTQAAFDSQTSSSDSSFVLHDGPPYANGDIHMGHVLNKVLKDIEARYQRGSDQTVEFVPGFDCHGLPIEVAVETKMRQSGKPFSPAEMRAECRKFAQGWVDRQTQSFKSLGIVADWGHPYLTMSTSYEAKIVQAFAELYRKGYLFQEERIVAWSPELGTALADSEVHHKEITEDAVYVKFPLIGTESYLLVWTTTPWTLVANRAVAFSPYHKYMEVSVKEGEELTSYYIMVDLLNDVTEALLSNGVKVRSTIQIVEGSFFEDKQASSPLSNYGRYVPLLPAEFVNSKQGTGFVHIAPAFGEDDFQLGRNAGLDIYCPLDKNCQWTEDVAEVGREFVGKSALSTNDLVSENLKGDGFFVAKVKYSHSYPHDERLDEKVIYRVSTQWFMDLDHDGLRDRLQTVISQMQWDPAQAEATVTRMAQDRPVWCISRQKNWGVGLPIFYNKDTGAIVANDATFEAVISLTKEHGSDAWFELTPEEILPKDFVDPETGSTSADLVKEESILSVWFDSAVSHLVLMGWPENERELDFVCEGIDQYGSWFQVSIILATALLGKPPYARVASHGFVLDQKGHAMSKSKGNVIQPKKMIDKYGVDVVRLWAASSDTNKDICVGDEILQTVKQDYLVVRNFMRFCLANLNDFDWENHSSEDILDYHFLQELLKMAEDNDKDYIERKYHKVIARTRSFVQQMNSSYLDAVKDVLYCDQPNSNRRRQVQAALAMATLSMMKMCSPILPLLTEEVASNLPRSIEDLQNFWVEGILEVHFTRRIHHFDYVDKYRSLLYKALEDHNQNSTDKIKPVEALAVLHVTEEDRFYLMTTATNLIGLANWYAISRAELEITGNEPFVSVSKAEGERCDRCWKIHEHCDETAFGNLCPRCKEAEICSPSTTDSSGCVY